MGRSPLAGTDEAPLDPPGRDNASLGPSDSSDTGSDRMGLGEEDSDSDAAGTGERAGAESETAHVEATDIDVDRSFVPVPGDVRTPYEDEDEDPDLSFIDRVRAEGLPDDEDPEADGEPPVDPTAPGDTA